MYKNLTNPRSSRATFRTAGIVGNGEDREEGEVQRRGCKDDDVDNWNTRQRHEEKVFLIFCAPMFAFLIG